MKRFDCPPFSRIAFAVILVCAPLVFSGAASAQATSYLYSSNGVSGDVSAYQISPATGALTPIAGSPFPSGVIAHAIAADPSGRFLYVANATSNTVTAFVIAATTGTVRRIGCHKSRRTCREDSPRNQLQWPPVSPS
jgi:YVTN family beta-propeller protein